MSEVNVSTEKNWKYNKIYKKKYFNDFKVKQSTHIYSYISAKCLYFYKKVEK